MSRHHGKNGAVHLATPAVASQRMASVTKWLLDRVTEKIKNTMYGDQNQVYVQTLPKISGEVEGILDPHELTLVDVYWDEIPVHLHLYPDSTNPGGQAFTLPAWLNMVAIAIDIHGVARFSAGFITRHVAGTTDIAGAATVRLTAAAALASDLAGAATLTVVTSAALSGTELAGAASLAITTTGELVDSEDDAVTTFTTTATGTQDNFNFGTLANLNVLRCNNASLLTIRGITNNGAAPADGQLLWIISVGAGQVDLANQHASSTAEYRLINNVTATISLAAGSGRALLEYDATTARWRVLQHEQGAWIRVPFNAGDFTGSGSMTVTAQSPNVWDYLLQGRTLHVALAAFNWSISGTPHTKILVAIPGGFTPDFGAGPIALPCRNRDNGTYGNGEVSINTDSGKLAFETSTGANWQAASFLSGVSCEIAFEVQ